MTSSGEFGAVHTFYFLLDAGSEENVLQRVAQIESQARKLGLSCHTEIVGQVTTVQVETRDFTSAMQFKFTVEQARHETHG